MKFSLILLILSEFIDKYYKISSFLLSMGDKDVSPTSKVEEYIRKFGGTDRFFEKILNSLDFPFGIINADTLEVEISNLGGFRPGIKCYELYLDRVEACERCPVREVVEGREKVILELENEDVFSFPIFGEKGRVVSVINYRLKKKEVIKEVEKEVIREVVKEKVVEKMSKTHEESFYNILQNSRDVVYRYDFVKGGFEYVSESIYTSMGFPLGEFIQMSYDEFLARVHPDDVSGVCEVDSEKGEAVCEGEYRWKCKDGKYCWFLDRRTWFFDENGRRVCVIGDIKDISLDKERDEEKAALEERIALMKKKENEAKERISLTDKERVVLWGICRFPLLNDEELAGKLELKRSTLTAIKNRLKGKGWFSLKYVPNFSKLGCQFVGVFDGGAGKGRIRGINSKLLKSVPEVVLSNYQNEKFFGVFVSDKYVEFRKFLERFEEENKEALRLGFNEHSFFYDLEDFELRDFSEVINSLFSLGRREKAKIFDFKGMPEELNINEKRVLHAMVRDSSMSSAEIAKKVWISKPTVIKIRNKLIDEAYIYAMVLPNFRKLGFQYFGRLTYEFDSDLPSDIKRKGDVSRTVLRVNGKRTVVKFILFASEEEYIEEVDLIRDAYRKSGVYFRLDSEVFAMQKRGKGNFDMEPFVNELLFSDEI